MPHNNTAVAQVGTDIEEIVIFAADLFYPKRHHLHKTAGAHYRQCVLPKVTFHLNQTKHHFRIKSGTRGFVMRSLEEIYALVFVGNFFL